METIELCSIGDVYLIPGDSPTKRYLVSSAILANCSDVFKAMFTGNFSEAQGLSSAAPKTVELPEDGPDATELMLRILHLKTMTNCASPTPSVFADLAVLCKKYQCEAAASAVVEGLLLGVEVKKRDLEDMFRLVATAEAFYCKKAFRTISLALVLRQVCFVTTIRELHSLLPVGTQLLLLGYQNLIKRSVRSALSTAVYTTEGCECRSPMSPSQAVQLLEDLDDLPLDEAIDTFVVRFMPSTTSDMFLVESSTGSTALTSH
ncbi:hypothetical protein BDZ85DRAFT_315607 [Elsinoe ampelina]|uniref:BTB domain-containing protein n=1 Tax=Elsinoe ampelina TaxID=302913 RepID=A0A6A6GRB1_9PEZI|nr:hypothetical protein BDZ85DRAFT_315607 [Elsinoe ampelina]